MYIYMDSKTACFGCVGHGMQRVDDGCQGAANLAETIVCLQGK